MQASSLRLCDKRSHRKYHWKCRIPSGSWSFTVICVPAYICISTQDVKFGFSNIPSFYPNRLRKTNFDYDNA